jgi:threonine dehydratase
VAGSIIDSASIRAAHDRVKGHVRRTPVLHCGPGSFGLDVALTLKLELLQHSGSFKVRGAFNNVLAAEDRPEGLLAASGGNHGLAVAYVARELGLPAEIYVPAVSSQVKRQRIAALGAEVRVVGDIYDDAQAACDQRAAESEFLSIHPYDHPLTVAGQATLGVEVIEQVSDVDTVIVAVGGGGLAAGLAAAVPESVRLVAVEPRTSCCFQAALASGSPVTVPVSGVAADSLGAGEVGALAWSVLADRAQSVTVTDEEILVARTRLWRDTRIACEPGAATALGALTSGRYSPADDEKVVVIVCGGNTDPSDLAP